MGYRHLSAKRAYAQSLVSSTRFMNATVIKHALVGNHLWKVILLNDSQKAIIHLDKLFRGDGFWQSRSYTEDCDPSALDCPLSILKLSTCEDSYAPQWRERVRAHHQSRSVVSKTVQALEPGRKVFFCGRVYTVKERYLRKKGSWMVDRDDGMQFRMNVRQINQALRNEIEGDPATLAWLESERLMQSLSRHQDHQDEPVLECGSHTLSRRVGI